MRLAMIYPGNLGLACNFETYRYSLPPAHMPLLFSCIYTIPCSVWPRTPPHEVNHHHYICFIPPIYNSFYISVFFSFSLSLDRPLSVRVDCIDIDAYFTVLDLWCFKFTSTGRAGFPFYCHSHHFEATDARVSSTQSPHPSHVHTHPFPG